MSILILPRLDSSIVRELLDVRWKLTVVDASKVAAPSHPRQKFASNGERMSAETIAHYIDDMRRAASNFGYPLNSPNTAEAMAWDLEATQITWKYLQKLVIAEAGRPDVWAFLTVVACPDLVLWRYATDAGEVLPSGLKARFIGGRRNLIKAFWQRGCALAAVDADWSVLADLREDDMRQVFERPSLSAVPRLAGTLLAHIASSADAISSRDILRRLNRELAVTALYCLQDHQLDALILDSVRASKTAIARSGKRTR